MIKPTVVVGAGMAGLVCARRLHRAGCPVLVLDADDRPGGRMKTDLVDGFRLDRGFQVAFTACPAMREELDFRRLDLRRFEPGVLVWHDRKLHEVHRDYVLHMALSRFFPIGDKMRVSGWNREVAAMSLDDVWRLDDGSTEEFLRQYGFSESFLEKFARPFFGGVFLDRSLSVSRQMFTFVWKMLLEGDTVLPALGIEEIPRQVAADLPADALRMRTRVVGLVKEGGRATGVSLADGGRIEADAVVLATDWRTASQIAGVPAPGPGRPCTTVYFAGGERPVDDPVLVVNGEASGRVNHVAVTSRVSSLLAPAGQHLIAASLLDDPPVDDLTLAGDVRYELQRWFPKCAVAKWRPLRVTRVPFAQAPMPPGFRAERPSVTTAVEGLFLAGEYTEYGSVDGACRSGAAAARAVLSARVPAPTVEAPA